MLLTFLPATRSVIVEFTLRLVIATAGTSAATVAFPAAVSASSTAIPSVSETVSATAASTATSTATTTAFTTFAFRLRRFYGDTSSVYLEAVHRVHDTVGFSLFYLEE